MLRLAVLVSGGGSNLQAILNAVDDGSLPEIKPALVIADRQCRALNRAAAAGVRTSLLDRNLYQSGLSGELDRLLTSEAVDMVALAGWLSLLDGEITEKWAGRMVNIHPSLLPAYGGKGMYGRHVHRAVLGAGDKVSGCSVHLVSPEVDGGAVLGCTRVPVLGDDTPETLAERVLIQEHKLYPKVLRELAEELILRK